MKYLRIRDNTGRILDGHSVRLGNGTEYGNGQIGVTDIRFVNDRGFYRRISGKAAQKIIKLATRRRDATMVRGGLGPRLDANLYDVALEHVVACDTNPDCLERDE